MAVTYGFYNSLNKDRVYNAEQMSSIFNGIITDGVFSTVGDALMPIAGTGMQVIVKTGRAWFNSTWTLNDAQLPLDIETADVSLTRIDAIVLEVNSAIESRVNSIKIVKGTPSANPVKPTMAASETLHQYALGYVTVAANVTSITGENIEVNVGKTGCPFITSVLQQVVIDDLFNQWTIEFETWFANIQAQLSGDVAANLQRQIDVNAANIALKLDKSAKASKEAVYNGVSDDTYITPKSLGSMCEKVGDVRFSARDSIGDSWLLADGSTFDVSVYPALSELIGAGQDKFTGVVKMSAKDFTATDVTNNLVCQVGDFFVVKINATRTANGNNGGYSVSRDFGTWVDMYLETQPDELFDDESKNQLLEISYIDGQYLIIYSYYPKSNIDTEYIKFGWTSDLFALPTTWTTMQYQNGVHPMDIEFSMGCPTIKWGDYYIQEWSTRRTLGDDWAYTGTIVRSADLITWTQATNLLNDDSKNPWSIAAMKVINNRLVAVMKYYGSYPHGYLRIFNDINLNETVERGDLDYSNYWDIVFDDTGAYVIVYYYNSRSDKSFYNVYYCDGRTGTVSNLNWSQEGSLINNPDGSGVLLLDASGKIYKILGSTYTLLGSLSPVPSKPPITRYASAFYYGQNLIAYRGSDDYIYGSFRNVCPNITAPAGTKAFIKAKAIS